MKEKNFNAYFAITKMGIMEAFNFRVSYVLTNFSNFFSFIVAYYLWKSIYESNGLIKIKGMTVEQITMYLVLAIVIYRSLNCFFVTNVDNDIKSGKICLDLLLPLKYPIYGFFKILGTTCVTFITTFIPIFIIACIWIEVKISLTMYIYFFLSLFLSLLINYLIDFFVVTLCFYTQSGRGINSLKLMIIQFFSGMLIPIAFFSDTLRKITYCLPFHAMYNIPLNILTNKYSNVKAGVLLQIFWIIMFGVIDIISWKKALKALSINGG